MSERYPILRSLDPHHARIGYLGALSTVGISGLDTTEALKSRFHDLLFERIYPDDPRFDSLKAKLDPARWQELSKKLIRSQSEDPSSILSDAPGGDGWAYISEFWLYDSRMPSPLGQLSPHQLDRTVDLARWTRVLLPTGELSEVGFILQYLLKELRQNEGDGTFNFLLGQARPALPLLYLRLMLASEMLFPFLIKDMVDRHLEHRAIGTRGDRGLLRGAVDLMLKAIGEPEDPEDILAVRDLSDFRSALLAKPSTEENYLRPRLEMLVDLGVVGRKAATGKSRSDFMWAVTNTTERLCEEWKSLAVAINEIPAYLGSRFFGSMSRVFATSLRKVRSRDGKLLWFTKAFQRIGREFGFTPGRTCALLACCLAWEAGFEMEIDEVFDAVYEAGRSEWSKYLHFSGGSRFDREFLIRIDQEAVTELEKAAHNNC